MIPEWMFAGVFLAGLLTGLGLVWRRLSLVDHLIDELADLITTADLIKERRSENKDFWHRLDVARELLRNIDGSTKAV